MQIIPQYRDAFPKSDLNGGFIGDGYMLCENLPDKPRYVEAGQAKSSAEGKIICYYMYNGWNVVERREYIQIYAAARGRQE